MSSVLILGATSAIAEATARRYAARGARLFLVARNGERLADFARDLGARGALAVGTAVEDLANLDAHAGVLEAAWRHLGEVDIVLLAYGVLPDGARDHDAAVVHDTLMTNTVSAIHLLGLAAARLRAAGRGGSIAAISSVAGDRGRRGNALYGASKAALDAYLSGLRSRLADSGIQVTTLKPGFVDSPMTAHLDKGPLFASPARIADGIVRAIERRRDVAYLPAFWRLIMLVVRIIPEPLFKRLSF